MGMDIQVLRELYRRTWLAAEAVGARVLAGDEDARALFESHVRACREMQRALWVKIRACRRLARTSPGCRQRTRPVGNARADVRYVRAWDALRTSTSDTPILEPRR